MRLIKISLFLLLVFLVTSCKKTDNVSGRVTNFYTGEPVKGILLTVEKTTDSGGLLGGEGSVNYLGQTTSDENGLFSLHVKNKKLRNDYFVTCQLYSPMTEDPIQEAYFYYFPVSVGKRRVELDDTKDQKIGFTVIPTCRIRFLVDSHLDQETDSIKIIAFSDDFSRPVGFNYRMYLPCNGKVFLHIQYGKRGVITERVDTIFVKQFEKIDYLIDEIR